MIRPTVPDDTSALVALASDTGVFKPAEIIALREVLDDFHSGAAARGHRAVTSVRENQVVGFAYYAPAAMTDGTWYLYWIAVDRKVHARGLGSELLRHAEDQARAAGCRLFLIETSSLPHYELTRRFYLKHGYPVWCIIRDYYADGDDMVIFARRMTTGGVS